MRIRDLERFGKNYLLALLPGFRQHRDLLVRGSIGDVLLGVVFNRSQLLSDATDVECIAMPVIVPEEDLILSHSLHLSPSTGRSWRIDEEPQSVAAQLANAIRTEGERFFEERSTVRQQLAFYESNRLENSFNWNEMTFYLLARLERWVEASARLDAMVRIVRGPDSYDYMQNRLPLAQELSALFGDHGAVSARFDAIRQQTLLNIGLAGAS
ncbi:MAG: hypothetical protein IT357_06505 [Gemmatimonadaceae bacterium]|nr:hypothetical protein [Gemmatimonadaceae bacterium]